MQQCMALSVMLRWIVSEKTLAPMDLWPNFAIFFGIVMYPKILLLRETKENKPSLIKEDDLRHEDIPINEDNPKYKRSRHQRRCATPCNPGTYHFLSHLSLNNWALQRSTGVELSDQAVNFHWFTKSHCMLSFSENPRGCSISKGVDSK